MADSGTQSELTPRQRRAVLALLSEKDVRAAALAAKVPERSLWRWLALPAFRAALTQAEGDLIDKATRRLLNLQDPAISVITVVLADKTISPGIRLRAAQSVLDYMIRLRELRNTEERLEELERRVYGNHQ